MKVFVKERAGQESAAKEREGQEPAVTEHAGKEPAVTERKAPKLDVVSAEGSRDSKMVGGFRIASAAGVGATLVLVSHLLAEGKTQLLPWAIFTALVGGFFAFFELSFGGRAARSEENRIRRRLLERQFTLASLPVHESGEEASTKVIQLMTDNTERVTEYRQVYFGATIAALAVPLLTLTYIAVAIDWVVGVVVFLMALLIPVLLRLFMVLFRKSSAHSRKQRGILAGKYLDAIRNLVTIRMLGAGKRVEDELGVAGEENRGAIMRLLAGNQVVIIVMDGLFSLFLIVTTVALATSRFEIIGLANLISIILLTVLLLEPLQQVAGFFYIGMGGIASQRAIASYLQDTQSLITRGDNVEEEFGERHLSVPRKTSTHVAVEMSDVHFSYGRGEVLTGVNLEVSVGSRVAIVGPSGVGKSTILGLLRGSLPPQRGLIMIGNHAIQDHEPDVIRTFSASVDQRTWMFTGTIADNLRMGRADATEEDMWDALRQAHVAGEVARMPQGLHTYIGEGAALVSGGQAQRLSIARALLSGRKLLLLDEPTSHVDIESEAKIAGAIEDLPRDWTIVFTTHRPSLRAVADHVYVVRNGALEKEEGWVRSASA